MNFAIGYEEGAVRALHASTVGCPEVKIYNSAKELYDDVGGQKIGLYQVGKAMFAVYDKEAEDNGEPCTYITTRENNNEKVTKRFFGNVVIVGFDPKIGAFLSLSDEQLEKLLCNSCVNSHPMSVRTVFRKPDAFPKVMSFKSEGEIKAFFGTDDLVLKEVGDKLYAISRSDAESRGEKKNLHHEYFDGYRKVVEDICGDVVIIGYDPKGVGVYDLSDEQLMGIMFTLEEVLD